MRSGRPSLLDSARFLWTISAAMWETGVRSRRRTIWEAITRTKSPQGIPAGAMLLVDHNPSKVQHAERVFGSAVTLVNPLALAHRLHLRALLIGACALPGRARGIATSLIHACNFRHHVQPGQTIVLWNPYTLLQFAVDERVGAESAYHLDASYPALRRVQSAYGCSVALDLIGYKESKHVMALQPWSFDRSEPVLVVYLSKLDEMIRHASELTLLDAVRAWRNHTVAPIEIFIHYTDRGTAVNDPRYGWFFDEFGDLVSDRDSLESSSRSQISLSALSTIGLDLLSMDIAHFVVVPDGAGREPHDGWRLRLDPSRTDVLRVGAGVDEWLRQIRSSQTELFDRVFEADAAR